MPCPRLFCPGVRNAGGHLVLPDAAAHHAIRVLRLREGDRLTLFDGEGGEFGATILAVDRHSASVAVGGHDAVERESRLPVTLVQSLQAGDRMDLTVQKAVELGVTAIVPVASTRSVVRLDPARAGKRLQHWREIVIAACEQCGRNRLPEVRPVAMLDEWLARPAGCGLRLHLSPTAAQGIGGFSAPAEVELLVGPEGGLTAEEVALAEHAGFRPLRLGHRVLRTETAGMAALAAIQARWGDFV